MIFCSWTWMLVTLVVSSMMVRLCADGRVWERTGSAKNPVGTKL